MRTIAQGETRRPGPAGRLTDVVCALDAELDAMRAAYLDLLAQHRAILSGSRPAIERARIDEAAALARAVAAGRLRMVA